MALNVNNRQADTLTRKFAKMEGVSITDAIVIAMKEAIERRRKTEKPSETAERLRKKYGFELAEQARKPLPKSAYDEMWED
jgi:antitoxin VapB